MVELFEVDTVNPTTTLSSVEQNSDSKLNIAISVVNPTTTLSSVEQANGGERPPVVTV